MQDYSIAFLLAEVAGIEMGQPISFELDTSTFGTDPLTRQPVTFDQWRAANPSLEFPLRIFLAGWITSQQKSGFTILGARFKLGFKRMSVLPNGVSRLVNDHFLGDPLNSTFSMCEVSFVSSHSKQMTLNVLR